MTTEMASVVLAFLATYLVHSTLLFGAAWLLGRYVVPGEAWRETLWKAALVGGLLTSAGAQLSPWTAVRVALPAFETAVAESAQPAAAAPVGDASIAERSAPESNEAAGAAGLDERAVSLAEAPSQTPTVPLTGDASSESSQRAAAWPWLLLTGWLTIAVILLVRLGWRRVRLARLLRDRRPVAEAGLPEMLAALRRTAGVWVPVRLTSSTAVASPLVLGNREICVPTRFVTELGADEQRVALAHELGHLARRDPAWLLCAMLLECVFFFQPLQRVARRGLRESAEYLADSWAVRLAGGRLSLARCLAEVAAWVSTSEEPALAEMVAMAEGGSPLLNRVKRLLEREPEQEPRRMARGAAAIGLVVVAGAFAPAVGGAPASMRAGPADDQESDFESSYTDAQDFIDVTHWPSRGSVSDGLRWAGASAREAGAEVYWVAWAADGRVPRGQDAASDSEPIRELWRDGDGAGVVSELGVTHDVARAGAFQDAIVLVRLVANGSDPRIERLAMRTPGRSMNLRGHVFWLGRQESAASLAWLRDLYAGTEDPRIRETVVEAIAVHAASDAPVFLRTVIESGAGRNLTAQAVEGLGWHPSDETLSFLLATARGNDDTRIRTEAAETLGELDHAGASAGLRSLIERGERRVRAEALETLAERGDTALAALLLDIALNDPDESMRREAVELMQELPAAVAVPLLRRVLTESRDESATHEAIETLAEIGTADAFAAIEEMMHDAASPARREAIEVLVEEHADGIDGETLLAMALHDDDPDLRRDAVEFIAELPSQQAVELLRRVAFESGDETAERQAAESLGDVGTIEALAVLDEIIARNPGEDASRQAVESMAENFARDLVIPRLTRIAREHPSRRVRGEALDQLAELNGGP